MKKCACVMMFGLILVSSAHALTAVRPIDGYVCMNLKWSGKEEDLWDESKLPAVYSDSSASSQKIGNVGAIAIVASPMRVQNGFAEILHLNGKKGWVEADLLVPYPKATDPSKTCVPSYMSNGRIGFGTAKH